MRKVFVVTSLIVLVSSAAAPAAAQENWTAVAPLELYKPDYFLMGQPDAKIQFSFKVRLLQDQNLYFGYSQLMKWELFRASPYFLDINYNPELFYRVKLGDTPTRWLDFSPFEHESNGQGGVNERSWNRAYIRYHDEWKAGRDAVLRGEFKVWAPYSLNASNRNLPDYRGLYETNLILSNFAGPMFDVDDLIFRLYPGGPSNVDPTRGGQEVTLRIRTAKPDKLRPVAVFQIFHGHAESLLDYRQNYWAWRGGIGF